MRIIQFLKDIEFTLIINELCSIGKEAIGSVKNMPHIKLMLLFGTITTFIIFIIKAVKKYS